MMRVFVTFLVKVVDRGVAEALPEVFKWVIGREDF
ncbi:hypothetical protein phi9181_ORF053 [Enterococcus phage 9181]|nr:hypothetical protein phi9181_ORF053 [Enterococcus phage 9181]